MKLTASSLALSVRKLQDRFAALSSRERRIMIAGAVILALWVTDAGILRPIQVRIRDLNETIVLRQKQALGNLASLAQKPFLEAFKSLLVQRLDLSATDDEAVRASMLQDLEQKARDHGIRLEEVKPQVATPSPGAWAEYRVRLQIESTMKEWVLFLADLVRTRKLYVVESFRISSNPEDVNKIRSVVSIKRIVIQGPADAGQVRAASGESSGAVRSAAKAVPAPSGPPPALSRSASPEAVRTETSAPSRANLKKPALPAASKNSSA